MIPVLAVAAGGAIGAAMRYGANVAATKISVNFPYGTLGVNIIGCFLIGLLAGLFALKEPIDPNLKLFLVTGVLGGFTTFSAFSLETLLLYERKPVLAAAYVAASVALCLAGCWAGLRLMRMAA